MAVLYNDHQLRPPVLSATAQVPFKRLCELVQDSVIRYVPSGACTVELTGLPEDACEVALPSSSSMFVTPPSLVANIVAYGPGACAPEGVFASYKVDNGMVTFNPILDRAEPWQFIRGVAAQPDPASLFSYQRKQAAGEDVTQYQVATSYGDPRDYGVFSTMGPLSLAGLLQDAGYNDEVIREVMRATDLAPKDGRAVIDLHARTGLLINEQVDVSWEATSLRKKKMNDFACRVSEADLGVPSPVLGPPATPTKPPVKKPPVREGPEQLRRLRDLKSQDAKDSKVLQHPVFQKSKIKPCEEEAGPTTQCFFSP